MAKTNVAGPYRVEGNQIVSTDNASRRLPWNPAFAAAHGLGGPEPVEQTSMRWGVVERKRRKKVWQ